MNCTKCKTNFQPTGTIKKCQQCRKLCTGNNDKCMNPTTNKTKRCEEHRQRCEICKALVQGKSRWCIAHREKCSVVGCDQPASHRGKCKDCKTQVSRKCPCGKNALAGKTKCEDCIKVCKVCNTTLKKNQRDYCFRHNPQAKSREAEMAGQRVCSNIKKGCENFISEGDFKRCYECRMAERNSQKMKHTQSIEWNNNRTTEQLNMKQCEGRCGKIKPIEDFINKKSIHGTVYNKQCSSCSADDREKRDRDYGEYENRPEVKLRRQKYRQIHRDRISQQSKESRARRIAEDPTGYHKHQAEMSRLYRKNNPEKMLAIYQRRGKDANQRFLTYKNRAPKFGIEFDISKEECISMFQSSCGYCGIEFDDGTLLGIDRIDPTVGYINDNCVACCTMCNFMKNNLDGEQFYKIIKNILSKFNFLDDHNPDYTDLPGALVGTRYTKKVNDSMRRGLVWQLSEKEHDEIIIKNCYLCDRPSNDANKNGIDRVDNHMSYEISNVQPCCFLCNRMKKDHPLDVFISKLITIWNFSGDTYQDCKVDFEQGNLHISNMKHLQKEPLVVDQDAHTEYFRDWRLPTGTNETKNMEKSEVRQKRKANQSLVGPVLTVPEEKRQKPQ